MRKILGCSGAPYYKFMNNIYKDQWNACMGQACWKLAAEMEREKIRKKYAAKIEQQKNRQLKRSRITIVVIFSAR